MHENVKEYYGKILSSSKDLKTNACCTADTEPDYLKQAMSLIHPEVSSKYYGCGLVRPQLLENLDILDLGSGSGRDCFLLSWLCGEKGSVTGIDMTDEQLEVANRYIDYHARAFGYKQANVRFIKGYIESIDLPDSQFDVIVSNCVINLSPDKAAVLKEAYRLLKPGGELYFSDVYSDRRIARELVENPVLYGECLSGALYWNDFLNLAKNCGFGDPRLVEDRPLEIDNPDIDQLIGHINFYSATYRLFKLEGLEPACEDYGQAVIYKGSIAHHPHQFKLDSHHIIETGKVFPVCGNTWKMLHETRFRPHFEFIGNRQTHYGIFPGCGSSIPFQNHGEQTAQAGSSCC